MTTINTKPVIDGEIPNIAPRVTPADIEAQIASEHYFTASQGVFGEAATWAAAKGGSSFDMTPPPEPLNLLTFCVLVLRNGFTVTGESACASPENFDADIGKRVARQAATGKVWPLLGFRLRDRLCAEAHAAESPDPQQGDLL